MNDSLKTFLNMLIVLITPLPSVWAGWYLNNVKCDFLDSVRYKIGVKFDIFGDYKYEDITSYYVVSRAFKKLEEIIRISREIIKVNHKLIILKGRNAENEINKLKSYENFIYKTENSITDSDSKILVIEIKK